MLKQSTAIDAFMQRSASTMKGRSEWDRQTANLKRLAEAYGTTFPLPEGGIARRMNDKETAAAAGAVAEAVGRFKTDLDRATGLTKPEEDAAKEDLDLVSKQANLVKSRVNDGRPASSEMQTLAAQVAGLQVFVDAHPLPSMTNWQTVQASLAKLEQAFGLTP